MKKLLWIINGNEGYGIERYTLSFADQFKKDSNYVKFVSLANGNLVEKIKESNFDIDILEFQNVQLYNEKLLFFFKKIISNVKINIRIKKRIEKVLFNENFDYLIYCSPNLTAAISILKIGGTRKFWTMPNVIGGNYPLGLNKRLYQTASILGKIQVIANSEYTASTIEGWGIRPKVAYLGVDPEQFVPDRNNLNRKDFDLNKDDIVFGIFARLSYVKAQDIVIKSFAKLIRQFPNQRFKLLLIGVKKSDPFFDLCDSIVNSEKIQESVIFIESVKNIQDYYALVNIMINSRRDAEPFGLSIIESMMMSKPVLAYYKGGPSETIIDGETGWLINEADEDGYYNGMCRVFSDKEKWIEMGEYGHKHAMNKFTSKVAYHSLKVILNG